MNVHGKDIKVFSGNAYPKAAEEIAKSLGLPLGRCTVGHFADGEVSVSLEESVRGSDVFIVQSTCNPVNDNLMELIIMIDAFRRASAGRITAVIPYFGYARQDRKAKARDPISAKVVANMLVAAGADRVLTMDLHASQIQGFFDIPVDHLMGAPILTPYFQPLVHHHEDEYVAVSPDHGSVNRVRKFAEKLDIPLAIIDKRRPKANVSEVMNIIGDVKGKKCIILDDMVDTAGTLCNAAKALIEVGGAKSVTACATHGPLSGPAIQRIKDSVLEELVLLDTIPISEEKRAECDKITVLPVAPVFAEAIERIYGDRPVSPLFI
ncbi:MAG: ribose-phosphate pyrophosphokinase [Oscillospiraceae bacterium]|nr:ribose-phosphate pyrophosphokinase [Oscillospiraceae bacterium]